MYQTYIKGYMGLPHLSQTHEASRMRLPCQCYKHNNPQSRDFPDLIGVDGTQHNVNIVDVIDTKTIQVDEDLRQYIGSFDEEGNVIIQTETTTITLEEYEALEDKSGFVKEEDTYTKTITSNVGNSILVRGEKVEISLASRRIIYGLLRHQHCKRWTVNSKLRRIRSPLWKLVSLHWKIIRWCRFVFSPTLPEPRLRFWKISAPASAGLR